MRTRADLRLHLLATVSALTLSIVITSQAKADDADRPTVWIELGGQLEQMDGGQKQFAPPFIMATPRPAPETVSPLNVGHPPRRSFGGEGKISFNPEETNWIFSAAVRFGRSNAHKHLHQQSYPTRPVVSFPTFPSVQVPFQYALPFSDADRRNSESHAILDFQVGKDVGVGMFGRDGASILGLGMRFAQFSAKSNTAFKSQPDFHESYQYFGTIKFPKGARFHTNQATAATTQSFRGIGPSLSWNASAPFVGNADEGEIAFDWGINGALLFGRQKANVHHQTTARLHPSGGYGGYGGMLRATLYRRTPPDHARSKSVIVPNVGGFAGLSFRYAGAKVSFGYRADFFFGALDGGIDTRQSEDRYFLGPFATVSVGLGG